MAKLEEQVMIVGTKVVIVKAPAGSPLVAHEGTRLKVIARTGGTVKLQSQAGEIFTVIGDDRSGLVWFEFSRLKRSKELEAQRTENRKAFFLQDEADKEEIRMYSDFASDTDYAKAKRQDALVEDLAAIGIKPKAVKTEVK